MSRPYLICDRGNCRRRSIVRVTTGTSLGMRWGVRLCTTCTLNRLYGKTVSGALRSLGSR